MNKNPHQARLGKKIRAKPGDLHEVQTIVWYTLKRAQYCLDIATAPEDIRHYRV